MTTKSSAQSDVGCLRVDYEELIEAFQSLGLTFLSGDVFSVPDFMRWLDEQVGRIYSPAEMDRMYVIDSASV